MLSFSQTEIHAKYKGLPNIFIVGNTMESSTITCFLFILSMEKNYQKKLIGFCSYSFCRAFHSASFERKTKISSLVCAKIFSKQTMLQTFWYNRYFTVFYILTIILSFLNEIQNAFFTKMIHEKKRYKV